MKVVKKRAPRVTDPKLDRIIAKIYDDINEVVNAVNRQDTSTQQQEYEGAIGSLMLYKKSDGTYQIRGKTEDGWVSTSMTLSTKIDL